MLYIHQYPDWTHFRFDSRKVLNALGETRLQEGKLIGAMETCGFQDLEQELLIQDIRSNSAIDGIHLDKAFVEQQVALVHGAPPSRQTLRYAYISPPLPRRLIR